MSTSSSSLSNLPLYGRKYSLTVSLPSGSTSEVINISDSSFEPEALRVTFDVRTVFYQIAWFAEINIYNLDQTTTQKLVSGVESSGQSASDSASGQSAAQSSTTATPIKQGMTVSLSAGYQNGSYGLIWSGPVFQALFVRENVTDFKITLHCLLWLDPLTRTAINASYAAGFNQTDIVKKIVAAAFGNGTSVNISPNISTTQLTRGKTVFGTAQKPLTHIADDNNAQWFFDGQSVNLAKVDDNIAHDSSALVFTTKTGLIGTPQQTQYGVTFRVLMNPKVKVRYPAMLVNIDNSQIIQLKRTIGELPGILDQSGTYIVIGARYIGDTRGNDWYVEIEGCTSVGGKLAMAQYLAEKASLNHG